MIPIDDPHHIVRNSKDSNKIPGTRQYNQKVVQTDSVCWPVDLLNMSEHFNDSPMNIYNINFENSINMPMDYTLIKVKELNLVWPDVRPR